MVPWYLNASGAGGALTPTDTLSALLHDVITAPNQGAHALAKSCATTALAVAGFDQSDARLAARHSALREEALVTALAQALKVVEQYDMSITDWLTASVAPLSGEPINLVVGTPCVFGAGCVHRGA